MLIAVNFAIVFNKQELRKGTVSGLPVPPAHYRFQSPYNDKCVKAVYMERQNRNNKVWYFD